MKSVRSINKYQSNNPYKRLKDYLKYKDSDGEWKEVGTVQRGHFQPTSFFRSDLWIVPNGNIRPTVKTKHRADIINFLKPYPSINQERLDEEERQRQAEERQRQEQLRLQREERRRQREQEEEERRQRQLERQERQRLEQLRQERLEQLRQERLEKQQQELLAQQERERLEREKRNAPIITSRGRVAKKNSRFFD